MPRNGNTFSQKVPKKVSPLQFEREESALSICLPAVGKQISRVKIERIYCYYLDLIE
jgi:hypothetical protein